MQECNKLTSKQYALVKQAWVLAGRPRYWSKRDFVGHLAMFIREAGCGDDISLIRTLNAWPFFDVKRLADALAYVYEEMLFISTYVLIDSAPSFADRFHQREMIMGTDFAFKNV